jgi:hypothetical protein
MPLLISIPHAVTIARKATPNSSFIDANSYFEPDLHPVKIRHQGKIEQFRLFIIYNTKQIHVATPSLSSNHFAPNYFAKISEASVPSVFSCSKKQCAGDKSMPHFSLVLNRRIV